MFTARMLNAIIPNLYNCMSKLVTLVRLIMTGNIVAGKNNGGYKYGEIAEKTPNLTRHYFTCNIIFTEKFVNPPNFTCHIAKLYPIFFPDCVFFAVSK